MSVSLNGYLYGTNAPGHCSDRSKCKQGDSSTEPYIVSHNMLNAHAAAVEIYRASYQKQQGGVIGITLNTDFAYPLTNSADDAAACER
jgi:beta-glucosidase